MKKKRIIYITAATVAVLAILLAGLSLYLLNYSL